MTIERRLEQAATFQAQGMIRRALNIYQTITADPAALASQRAIALGRIAQITDPGHYNAVTNERLIRALQLREAGKTYNEICAELGIGISTLEKYLKK